MRSFALSSNSPVQSDTGQSGRTLGLRDNQSPTGKGENKVSDWLFTAQRGLSDRQQHVTAFLPWTESQESWTGSEKTVIKASEAVLSPEQRDSHLPFTGADISQGNYRKIAENKTTEHDHVHHSGLETELHSISMWRASDIPANPYSLEEIGSNVAGQRIDGNSGNPPKDPSEVTFISAQKMLDNFMSQIPAPAHEGPLDRDHMGRDWARRPAEGL